MSPACRLTCNNEGLSMLPFREGATYIPCLQTKYNCGPEIRKKMYLNQLLMFQCVRVNFDNYGYKTLPLMI